MAVVGLEFVRIGGEFRSVSVGSIRYRGALTLCVYIFVSIQQSKINNSKLNKRERVRVVERRNECGGIESMEGIVGGNRDRTAEETDGF